MSKSLLHITQGKYPFGLSHSQNLTINRTFVKQKLHKSNQNLLTLLKTCQLSKKLTQNPRLIKIQKILEQDDTICLHYEYVPIQLQKYIDGMDEKFIRQYRNQMFELASLLAENRIICDLSIQRMGVGSNYQAKYFLGVDFQQKKQVNIFELKNDYVEQIKRFFQPYLNRKIATQSRIVPQKQSKNLVRVDTRMSDAQQISGSYLVNNNLIKTRKHESIYYERTKDHEIKKRKESYMSSVSNLRLNNLYKRINEIELQVCNTRGLGSNGKFTGNNNGGFKMSIQGREYLAKSSFGGNSCKKSLMELQKQQLEIYKGALSGNHTNIAYLQQQNSAKKSYEKVKNNSLSITNGQQKSNFIKYPGYDHSDDDEQIDNNRRKSPIAKDKMFSKNLQMSVHQIMTPKEKAEKQQHHKKFSTQFPNLADFQQPIMALTNGLRISANGLDNKNQRKVNKKIQLFKERQYSEIKSVSGNTNYIKDFMSVLQQQTSMNQRKSRNNQFQSEDLMQEIQKVQLRRLLTDQSSQGPFPSQSYSQNFIKSQEFNFFNEGASQKANKKEFGGLFDNSHGNAFINSIPIKKKKHPISCQQVEVQNRKLKNKLSLEQKSATTDIQGRVKGVIENSKKLIEKLRDKVKKNN